MEGCGEAVMTVQRTGPEIDRTCFVDFKTLDGTASAGDDFEYNEGSLCFKVRLSLVNCPKVELESFQLEHIHC